MAKSNTPADLKYAKTDEWVKIDGNEAVIGITDYAQNALSDVVYVELPLVGDTFKAGERFGTVESVKAASDVNAPIGGTVTAVNKDIENTPETINKDPYGAGWFIRIKPANLVELDSLLDAAAYEQYSEERG
jgi:glycine cleavage system H protein